MALALGGRTEVPPGILLVFVAGILLPFLNVYFVLRDLISGRGKDAAIGVILSIVAVMIAVNPFWRK